MSLGVFGIWGVVVQQKNLIGRNICENLKFGVDILWKHVMNSPIDTEIEKGDSESIVEGIINDFTNILFGFLYKSKV